MNVSERLSDMQYTPVSVAFSCGKKFFRFSLMIIYQLLGRSYLNVHTFA